MTTLTRRLAAVCLATVLAACAPHDVESADVDVVATTSVLGDVVAEVVGDGATVETLIPRGADPHDYQASAAQAASVRRADLVVAVGLGLEEGLASVLEAAAADGVPVLEVAPQLDPIAGDPHVWLDPLRMAEAARLIGARLEQHTRTGEWSDRADRYAEHLEAVHEEATDVLAAVPPDRRLLVCDHDSLGYFAQRYDFTVLGTIVPGTSPLAAPTARHLATLAARLRDEDVPAVFIDVTSSDTVAEALRREAGGRVTVVRLHVGSLGPPDTAAGTYEGLVLDNARRIADALGG